MIIIVINVLFMGQDDSISMISTVSYFSLLFIVSAKEGMHDAQVVEMPIIDSMPARPAFLPLAVPEDLADRLSRFHSNPAAWWIGQFVTYLTRPQPQLERNLKKAKFNLNFSHPIVG